MKAFTLRNDISTQQIDPQTGILQDVDLIFLGGTEPSARDSFAFAEGIPITDSLDDGSAYR